MSVINQMLLDLERRRAQPVSSGSLAGFVRPLPAERAMRIPPWLVSASAAVVIGTLLGFALSQWVAPTQGLMQAGRPAPIAQSVSQPLLVPENVVVAPVAEAASSTADAQAKTVPNSPIVVASVQMPAPAIDVPGNDLGVLPAERSAARDNGSAGRSSPTTIQTRKGNERARPADMSSKPMPPPVPGIERADPVSVTNRSAPEQSAASTRHFALTRTDASHSASEHARPAVEPVPQQHRPSTNAPVGSTELEVRTSARQKGENDYRRAVNLFNQGRIDDARTALVRVVAEQPDHDGARQTLIGILIRGNKPAEAEALADDRLARSADHLGFAMISARLKLERGDLTAALETLRRSAPHAQSNADYLAFQAAVLQRLSRHGEAVEQYRSALKRNPGSGVWLMGLGISLQALDHAAEAQDAFRRAREASGLTPELKAYIDQRITQLDR